MTVGRAIVVLFILLGIQARIVCHAQQDAPAPSTATEETAPADEQLEVFSFQMDETHDYLQENILDQVIRLDDFFGRLRTGHPERTSYRMRWRNGLRVDDDGKVRPSTTIRANLHLSGLSERLRLTISGEDVNDARSRTLPEDPGNPGFDRTTTPTTRLANTELRYFLIETPQAQSFVGAGIRFILPPQAFLRARYQYNRQISNLVLLRTAETLFVRNPDGFGESTEIILERLMTPATVVRWSSIGTLSQSMVGLEWGSELSTIHELSAKSAVTVTAGAYGNTGAVAAVSNYRVFTTYRRNFLRKWLFYEVEPEVSWPREASGNRPARFALTLRLEILFSASAADKVPPPWP